MSWVGIILARLVGGVVLYALIFPNGLDFWNLLLYWFGIILVSEGGARCAIRDWERCRV